MKIKQHQFQQYADQVSNIAKCGNIAKEVIEAEDICCTATIYGKFGGLVYPGFAGNHLIKQVKYLKVEATQNI